LVPILNGDPFFIRADSHLSIAPDWMLQQNAVPEGAERTGAAATAHKAAISLGMRLHRQNCVLLNQWSIFFSFYSCSIGTTS
jgi:hypothetical protein